jgi:hypothetical protein
VDAGHQLKSGVKVRYPPSKAISWRGAPSNVRSNLPQARPRLQLVS